MAISNYLEMIAGIKHDQDVRETSITLPLIQPSFLLGNFVSFVYRSKGSEGVSNFERCSTVLCIQFIIMAVHFRGRFTL